MRRTATSRQIAGHLALAVTIVVGFARCASSDAVSPAERATFEQLFRVVANVPLGAATDRFDYQSLDATTGRLYIAKMGSGQLQVFDVRSQVLVATLDGFPKVTGVLAVPELHKVYASVPGAGLVANLHVALGMIGLSSGTGALAVLDSDTLTEKARLPAGVFPDGIAYDPDHQKIFVTDELGSAIEVFDARADKQVARIDAGGEVGNVRYDPVTHRVYAPIQSHDQLAVIDPEHDRMLERWPLVGGKHPHGLWIATGAAIGYVACDSDDRLVVVDLASGKSLGSLPLARDPDVLAEDASAKRLYVATETGLLSVFDITDPVSPKKLGEAFVGDDAHSVAVDPGTHRLFMPLRNLNGQAVLRILEPRTP